MNHDQILSEIHDVLEELGQIAAKHVWSAHEHYAAVRPRVHALIERFHTLERDLAPFVLVPPGPPEAP